MRTLTSTSTRNITVSFLLILLFTLGIDSVFPKLVAVSARSSNLTSATTNSTNLDDNTNHTRFAEAYGRLPMTFEINQGQVDKQVSFLSRGSGFDLFLTSNEAVLSLNSPQAQEQRTEFSMPLATAQASLDRHTKHDVLRMKLADANPSTHVTGIDELPGKSNYLLGNDPNQWRTNVAHYGKVKYEAVYSGVDLVYYGNQQQLEYDFIVAPGANPSAIKQVFEGTQGVEIDANGDLVLRTRGGDVRQRKPFIYQETDGRKHQIAGGYVKTGKRQVGFEVGAYDTSLPLVIDPVLIYASYLGGSDEDLLTAIDRDGGGNAYVTGYTRSLNFPTTGGAFKTSLSGTDVYVTKFDPTGSILLYSTYLGGTSGDYAYGLAVDSAGNAYIAGTTNSFNFPTTPGAFDPILSFIPQDVFVTKLSPSGSSLIYSTFLGGSNTEEGVNIAIDGAGSAYVTGYTKSLDFPTTPGVWDVTFNSTDPNNEDGFATKLNATGSALVCSTYLGGTNRDVALDIAVDGQGSIYVAGGTLSPDFPRTIGAFDVVHNGSWDIFVVKLNSTASWFYYGTFVGGSDIDIANGLAIDAAGYAYVTGYTTSSNLPTTSPAFDRIYSGLNDAFVTKVNQWGTGIVYSTYLGGTNTDIGNSVAVDGLGQAYVTGFSYSTNFPTTVGALDTSHNGNADAYVTKINQTGSWLLYSTFYGGSAEETAHSIALDAVGNVYVGGRTKSTNFPATPGAFSTTYNGGLSDSFVAKFQF